MRLDKFLKVSRLIKRRVVAKDASDAGRITVNGNVAKASTNVKINDIIEIRFANSKVTAKVLEIKEHVLKEDACNLYELM